MTDSPIAPWKPPTPARVRRVHQLLLELYGTRTPNLRDPLDGLVLIILSQATNDYNCDRAFESLKKTFPTWEEVLAAPVESVADAIRTGGLANQKAERIKGLLAELQEERGSLDLSWMHGATAQECEAYLGKFHGVGPKTVACVLVFFLGKPAFPVDTHVFRVCKRLGWIRDKASPDEAHRVLKAVVPPECMLDLHVNLISHGRAICRADGNGGPRCGECTLRRHCDYGRMVNIDKNRVRTPDKVPSRDPDFFVTIKQKKEVVGEAGA